MGHHARTPSAGELIDLAALGCLAEQPRSPDAVVGFVRTAGGPTFTPTTEVVVARLERLVEASCASTSGRGEACRLRLTERGRARLVRLLRCEAEPQAGGLSSVWTLLKLCFLEQLGPELRGDVLASLIAGRRRRLWDIERRRAGACPALERCLARAIEREEAELAWLHGFCDDQDRARSDASGQLIRGPGRAPG